MSMHPLKYCESVFGYRRRPTHEVMVGDVGIGGNNPIRIQSMTISDTMDTEATVREVIELAEAGCEIVRITAPSMNEAHNLKNINNAVRSQGVKVPLVADIHYTPNAALIAADFVEKVRINPGNYADKKKFEVREYTDAEYAAELERIRERFSPLVLKCKTNGVAMRIGVNHGSLSDRVMNRYGDTPEGMVQSALEFIAICEDLSFKDIVVSMKSSNPQVMIQAYRLLAARMYELNMTYPLHLGVTEAGDGEDGRIKSAVGIGALLEDGIGDTIRVSLTEDAIYEVPVARALARKYNTHSFSGEIEFNEKNNFYLQQFPPFESHRRVGYRVELNGASVGAGEPVRIAIHASSLNGNLNGISLPILGQKSAYEETQPEWLFCENGAEIPYFLKKLPIAKPESESSDMIRFPVQLDRQNNFESGRFLETLRSAQNRHVPVYIEFTGFAPDAFREKSMRDAFENIIAVCADNDFRQFILGLDIPAKTLGALTQVRKALAIIAEKDIQAPITLQYTVPHDYPNWKLDAAATLGSLLCDGIGDAVYLSGDVSMGEAVKFSYNLLQATRLRISKTDFISCPSCGRTLFNLQTTTARIKVKTEHLKGVKIAIMGCIVNGPGEMADADFGYVGAGPGKVNLFVGKECVERNILENEADSRLIDLIKRHGKWVEPAPNE